MAKLIIHHKKNKQIYSVNEASRSAKRRQKIIYSALTAVVVLLLLAISYLVYSLITSKPLFPGSTNKPSQTATPPKIEARLEDGKPYHRFTFYGEDGQTVSIPEANLTFSIVNGQAVYDIPDEKWIPDAPTQSPIKVKLYPRLLNKDGSETPVDTISFDVPVERASFKLYTPKSEEKLTTHLTEYTIRFTTSTTSTVFLNDVDITAGRDTTGLTVFPCELKPVGDQTLTIKVQEPKHITHTVSLVFDRPQMPVELSVSEITKRTTDGKIVIKGTAATSATIACDQTLVGKITQSQTSGSFNMTVSLSRYGYNTIKITATDAGGQVSTVEYNVYYAPDIDQYSRSAWKLTDTVLSSPANFIGDTYLIREAKITEIVDLYPTLAKAEVALKDDAGTVTGTYTAYFKYTGAFMFDVGDTYRIFADVEGALDGAPVFIIYEGKGFID